MLRLKVTKNQYTRCIFERTQIFCFLLFLLFFVQITLESLFVIFFSPSSFLSKCVSNPQSQQIQIQISVNIHNHDLFVLFTYRIQKENDRIHSTKVTQSRK